MSTLDTFKRRGVRKTLALTWAYVRGWRLSRKAAHAEGKTVVWGPLHLENVNGSLCLGSGVLFFPNAKIFLLGYQQPARLSIGSHTSIGHRTELHVGREIIIGSNCRISWDCMLLDHDYHALDGAEEIFKPINVADDVYIGCRAIILKGVHIGRGAIVGAGAVVTRDVLPGAIVVGNPAKFVRWRAGKSQVSGPVLS
ncbi:MAG: acyltransferase [Verrucomicrobia bacterium]|nr:MAG: acyltransferase [Verrucomicrobiota bacterium]